MGKVYLIDIDGTISDDIKNEDSHLYKDAGVLPHSKEVLNKWYDEGNSITFFTARVEEDREVTETWLNENGYKYHGLIMNKPRIKDDQEYVWIDNRPVSGIIYSDNWLDLDKRMSYYV
jgi:uncharacterized HAD superfamily protein